VDVVFADTQLGFAGRWITPADVRRFQEEPERRMLSKGWVDLRMKDLDYAAVPEPRAAATVLEIEEYYTSRSLGEKH
jgi:hypothetical protein